MALYILGVFLAVLVASALILHYGFAGLGLLPDPGSAKSVTNREFFKVDYTLFLNLAFLAMSAVFTGWKANASGISTAVSDALGERILLGLALLAFVWLAAGAVLAPLL
jgi:hypothetical protein